MNGIHWTFVAVPTSYSYGWTERDQNGVRKPLFLFYMMYKFEIFKIRQNICNEKQPAVTLVGYFISSWLCFEYLNQINQHRFVVLFDVYPCFTSSHSKITIQNLEIFFLNEYNCLITMLNFSQSTVLYNEC